MELSRYQRFILNKIIPAFEVNKDMNMYGLVTDAVSQKCILPSQNTLIMETYYDLTEFLMANKMILEKEEMTAYTLTEKGSSLAACGTIEAFEKRELEKEKRSILQKIFYHYQKVFLPTNVKTQTISDYE